jgi:outer membrane murein-binding lipoprotein Lpp
MINFSTEQLSWIVIGACAIGGTGYLSMNDKIDNLSTKVSVTNANLDNTAKHLEQMRDQLLRIESKIDSKNEKR